MAHHDAGGCRAGAAAGYRGGCAEGADVRVRKGQACER